MRLDWLIARPIAHRGLHDAAAGIIENTASAFSAAIAGGYAIECDLQISADGEALVYHDDALGRLTEGGGRLAEMTVADLKAARFKATADRMLTLGELRDLVGGRTTLAVELKSQFAGDLRLVQRVAAVLANYAGPVAAMSFDPDMIAGLRALAPRLTRGIIAERHYRHADWYHLTQAQRRTMAHFLHWPRTRPHFVAYAVKDLPAAAPLLARTVLGVPLLTWTVRDNDEQRRALRFADQIIFEGFRP
jgi:glycerophosphoryl diester phosphodiesterase